MKKLILLIFLFAGSVSAADWCATFEGYRNSVKDKLGVDRSVTDDQWADTVMNDIIRGAVIYNVNATRAIKETFSTTTTYDVCTYTLDTGVLGVTSVYWSKNDSVKTLLYAPKETWYQLKVPDPFGKKGYDFRPSYYDTSATELWLYPTPKLTGDTISYDSWRKVPSISAIDSLSIIPQSYRVLILSTVVLDMATAGQHPMLPMYERWYARVVRQFGLSGGAVENPN